MDTPGPERRPLQDELPHAPGLAELRAALARAPVMVRELDGSVRLWTEGTAELYGWTAAEAQGRISHDLLRTVFPVPLPEIEATLRREGMWHGELRHRRKDGTEIIVGSHWALQERPGCPPRVIETNADITEVKRAQEDRLRLAAIVESSDDAIISKSLDGTIMSWNRGAERMLGYSAAEMVGRSITILAPPGLEEDIPRILARIRRGEMVDHYETRRRRKDGRIITVSLTISPIREADGTIIGASKIARDITAQKAAEAEMRELNARLEQRVAERTAELAEANAELEAFAYSVAHDLRAPLRGMEGLSRALLEDYADRLDDTGRDYARRIADNARRLDALIQDLLAYSRLTRTELRLEPVELAGLVPRVLHQVAELIAERGAEVELVQPLPAVRGQESVLVQVLGNLIGNAVKFVAPETSPHVTLRAEEREDCVRLWVEDNGIGILPEHQEKIFRVFQRLHGSRSYPGTGIGLAVVRKGVERLGGQAGVESAPGQGSRFWIELRKA